VVTGEGRRGSVPTVEYEYDPSGRVRSVVRQGETSAVATDAEYDGAGQLTSLVHWTEGSDLQRYEITRDSRGNPTEVTTTTGGGSTGAASTSTLYTYDVVSRLKSECYPATGGVCTAKSPRTSYTYDKVGNRTAESVRTVVGNTATTVVTDYTYDAADQLLTESAGGVATVTNTWSANGALATSTTPTGTQTYVTDLTDELISLTLEDGSLVGYTQDAQGNRTSRTVDGVLDATWAWDDLSSLPTRIGEYDAEGALTTSWLADPTSATGASLAQTSSGVSSWFLSDPFANTVATVSTTGSTVSGTRTMDAFGVERTPATGALADAAVGFAGQYLDAATGLYDMRARDYDPTSGRFTANDPVAIPTGMPYVAGYSYAFNNPLTLSDPSGLTPCASTGAGEAACLAAYYRGTGYSASTAALLPPPHPGVVDWTIGNYDVCTADGLTAWFGAAHTAVGTTSSAASRAGTNLNFWRWYGEGSPSTVSASGSMLSSVSRPGAAQTLNTIGRSPSFQFGGTGIAGLSLVTSAYTATQSSLSAGEEPGLAVARAGAGVASTSAGILAAMGTGAAIGTLIPVPVLGTVTGAVAGLFVGLFTTYVVNDQLNKQIDREYYGG
jgi:RHS repeat-associated protein